MSVLALHDVLGPDDEASSSLTRKPSTGAMTSVVPSLPSPRAMTWSASTRSPGAASSSAPFGSGERRVVRLAADDLDLGPASLADDLDDAVDVADLGLALGDAGLEQLLDARQAGGDVEAGDAAGVERPHRELRARLADRLGGDDADRLADADQLAGGEVAAVARPADAVAGLAGER